MDNVQKPSEYELVVQVEMKRHYTHNFMLECEMLHIDYELAELS
jgi:hypothetical protein